MDDEDTRASKKLVKMYSFDVAERLQSGSDAYALGQLLDTSIEDPQSVLHPWRKFFEPEKSLEHEWVEHIAVEYCSSKIIQ